ncbi:pre-mRNA-processing protein 40C [Rutidosis leptorrhynchoides]|uniref:pre-mRNA-processing protein 40C n=1 Tax=Rutidosis leptorrhynchoides TaxID=125765 RepID=UPI003A995BC9
MEQTSPSSTPSTSQDFNAVTPTIKDGDHVGTDSMHDADSANHVNSRGHVGSTPSFPYNVTPNANTNSESPYQLSFSSAVINSPGSSSIPRPPFGVSAGSGPSFSYNIPQAENSSSGGQSLHSRTLESPNNVSLSATSMQPPVPGNLAQPNSFIRGTSAQGMPPPSPVDVPREPSSNAASFSYNGHQQLLQKDQSVPSNATSHVAQGPIVSSTASVPHSVPQHAHSTLGATSSNTSFSPPPFWMPSAPSFQPPPGAPRIPVTPGPPGRAPATHIQSGLSPQQPFFVPNSPMVGPAQGIWLQPQPIGGFLRPQRLPYPPAFPGPFPLLAQPPAASIGVPGVGPISSAVSDSVPNELPPGTGMCAYNKKHASAVGVEVETRVVEQLDAWSAHRTETGTIYYYNAVTGQSTYQKPAGYMGEPDKVYAQPTPISWEKCAGTDWSLVTTNDGKRYYYNAKTKLSSWQIPTDVSEMKKKLDNDALKEQPVSIPTATILTEKLSAPVSLSAPAINTGGRDAISPATLNVPVSSSSSSALDLIKKKLQDSTASATDLPHANSGGAVLPELNGSVVTVDQVGKGGSHSENGKDKMKDDNKADGNLSNSSSDSEDVDSGPTKEERAIQFKEMLKERGVAPFSKWEKELPKFVFDPRFKSGFNLFLQVIPSYSARRAIFDHFVRTRAEEERKEKRAAQKAAIEGYKQLLDEAKEDINHNTDYQTFKRKRGHDPRFEALDRKEREALLNERVLPLKKSIEEEARAKHASFKSMLRDNKDISSTSRWSKVKDILRNDPRYKSVKHEDREVLFNEYIAELKESEEEAERAVKAKRDEEDKLKERERVLRKRKEREEQEVERVRSKARRKEAIESYQALLVESIKDPQVSWTDAKLKLEKDPQGRADNSYLDQSDLEKLFREHIKLLHDRCANEYKALLADVITTDAATKEYEDGKTVFTSWSTAKNLLKNDARYSKLPRKDRESLWRRHVDDLQRRRNSTVDQDAEKHGSRRTHDRR